MTDADHLADERLHDAGFDPRRVARLVTASSVPIERPSWAWVGRVPVGGVTLLAGREGLGKTALVGHVAARLTRGQLAGAFAGNPADVIYIGVEDDRSSVLLPRLIAAGADLERFHFVDLPEGVPFSIDEDVEILSALLPEGVALVVVDPLDACLGASVDSHRKAEVQRAIGRLAVLAQEHRCAVVGIAHLNKGDARDLLSRVVGSVGFTTSVRSVIGVGEHPDDDHDRVAVLAKSNLADKSSVPALRFRVEGVEVPHPDGETVGTAAVVILGEELGIDPSSIVSGLGADERSERDAAADWLTDFLAGGAQPYREVERAAAADSIARRTLHRAKARLGIVVTRDETARGRPSTWALPDSVPQGLVPGPVCDGWHEIEPLSDKGYSPTGGVSCHVRESGTKPGPACEICGRPARRYLNHDRCDEHAEAT